MFARLHPDAIITPPKTDSPALLKSFKRRLSLSDDDDDDVRPPSSKKYRKTYYSITPLFDKYRMPRVDEGDQIPSHIHSRRQRLSPSLDPDPPLVLELGGKINILVLYSLLTPTPERYANLRATVHSAAIAGLEEAEADLVAQSEANIRANRQKMAVLEVQLSKLVSPLQDLTIDYTATGEDGRERTAAIAIRDAISTFEAKLEAAAETQAEIEDLAEETLSRKGSDGAADGMRLSGASVVSGISPSASASHVDGLARFGTDLDRASKDVVDEMMTYEEKFLKEIEKEAGNILHSFLNR
ncbi:hypothetical protein F4814DRAFT_441693 [Daldinia grandis]|nr:hypothetical protein F4814DRAFT_441693 [Daldinia grandis]